MNYLKTYLDILNVILCVIIIGFVLFGSNKKCLERFDNLPELTEQQKNFLLGVQNGIIDNAVIQTMIRDGGVQKEDIQRIINYLAKQPQTSAKPQTEVSSSSV